MTTNNNNTIYDDVYKTMLEKFPELIIPLVNEEFHQNYPMNAKIESLNLESHKEEGHVIADSVFKIENHIYHVECQSNIDNTIAVRILEYDFYMALKGMVKGDDDIFEIEFPKSCVIYLRHNENTKESMKVRVKVTDTLTFDYEVPIVKAQEYTVEEIFEKKLFMLLPFYIMRYEKTGNDTMEEEEIAQIVEEYKKIVSKMEEAFYSANDIDGERLCAELLELMKRLAEYILRNNENAKREIGGAIMGGTAFKTLTERLEEAEAEKEKFKAEKEQAEAKIEQAEVKIEQAEAEKEQLKREADAEIQRLRRIMAEHGWSE